jgi:para-aminobenzoate synthetase component 1
MSNSHLTPHSTQCIEQRSCNEEMPLGLLRYAPDQLQGAAIMHSEKVWYLFTEPLCSVTFAKGSFTIRTHNETKSTPYTIEQLNYWCGAALEQQSPRSVPHATIAIAYEFLHAIEEIPRASSDPIGAPDLVITIYRTVRKFEGGILTVFRHTFTEFTEPLWCDSSTTSAVVPREKRNPTHKNGDSLAPYDTATKARYAEVIESIKRAIYKGDVYQVNFARHFATRFIGNPYALWLSLIGAAPAPYSALLIGDMVHMPTIISNSPELFFTIENKEITCSPIKGTRMRGSTAIEDATLKESLLSSTKDRAELAMVVDVVRNDLAHIANVDSIRVHNHARCETFTQAHHLVTEVRATIAPECTFADIIRALFPCASITGAPKIAAMKEITRHEEAARGFFCGAIGMIGSGYAQFSVAIRIAQLTRGCLHFHAGSGVTIKSDAEDEYEECSVKALQFLKAL